MGRADYFERSIHAARHVLGDFDQEAFLKKIDTHRVGIAFDASIANVEAATTVDLLVRLTARFYPMLAIVALDRKTKAHQKRFAALATAINPNIDIVSSLDDVQDLLVVGTTKAPADSNREDIYVGSDGWIAKLSSTRPVGSGNRKNPFGAGFAACIAAANIFRGLFSSAPRDEELSISVFDLDPTAAQSLNPDIHDLDVGDVFLVGAGAIGNGFLWTLSKSPIKGRLAVVDHESVDLGNLQRYVLTERKHEGAQKTCIAHEVFGDHDGVSVHPVPHRWDEFLEVLTKEQWKELRKVVVALDTAKDRIGVQASLPHWIVNAWTQGSEIGVSRHDFLGDQACMACLYIPKKPAPHLDEQIAQALGFPVQQLQRVRTLIETGQGLDVATLAQIATAKNVPLEKLLPFEGKPIQTLYTRGVCSGEVFELSNGAGVALAEVPMPFQSALAGILQAASLLRNALDYPSLPTITQIDLMRPFPTSRLFSRPQLKSVDHCFCVDVDYQEVYREKYHLC